MWQRIHIAEPILSPSSLKNYSPKSPLIKPVAQLKQIIVSAPGPGFSRFRSATDCNFRGRHIAVAPQLTHLKKNAWLFQDSFRIKLPNDKRQAIRFACSTHVKSIIGCFAIP